MNSYFRSPRIPKAPTEEQRLKEVEDAKKAKTKRVRSRFRRRQSFKRAKAKDVADIKKTLKQIDKAKHPKAKPSAKTMKALKGNRAIQKAIGVGKHAGKLRHLKGLAKGGIAAGITIAADKVTNEVLDRAFKGKMTLKEYRAEKALFKKLGARKYKALKQSQKASTKTTSESSTKSETKPTSKTKPSSETKPTSKTKPISKAKPISKTNEAAEKAAWLEKTKRSPAATAKSRGGKQVFSDNERWELQKRHRAWKAARRKKKK